jgi:hypothetical protein
MSSIVALLNLRIYICGPRGAVGVYSLSYSPNVVPVGSPERAQRHLGQNLNKVAALIRPQLAFVTIYIYDTSSTGTRSVQFTRLRASRGTLSPLRYRYHRPSSMLSWRTLEHGPDVGAAYSTCYALQRTAERERLSTGGRVYTVYRTGRGVSRIIQGGYNIILCIVQGGYIL